MKFAIQINAAPWQSEGCDSAYQFIRAALALRHEIVRVFFYHEGVCNSLRRMAPPEDEAQSLLRWSQLAAEHGIDLAVCVSAASRRGLLVPEASDVGNSLAAGFRIGGLGLWVDACLKADRFLAFGG